MAQEETPRLSIDALNPAASKAWRLQRDESWRKCRFAEPLKSGDFSTLSPDVARRWLAGRLKRNWLGQVGWESTSRTTYAPGDNSLHAIAHRFRSPSLPLWEDLQEQIAGARYDQGRRVICLDLHADFSIRDPENERVSSDPGLAAYGDELSGEDCLGPGAGADDRYVNETFRAFLEGWYQHLRTGRVGVYAGESEWGLDVEELTQRINDWKPKG